MSDRNVESVVDRLHERADVGLAKYGVTTERTDLDFESWLQHLQDELLDGAVYIARLRTETVPQSLQDAEHWKARTEAAEARCARLEKALNIFMREWDAYGENDHGYSEDPAGVMNDAWKAGFITEARAALSDTAPIDAAQEGE